MRDVIGLVKFSVNFRNKRGRSAAVKFGRFAEQRRKLTRAFHPLRLDLDAEDSPARSVKSIRVLFAGRMKRDGRRLAPPTFIVESFIVAAVENQRNIGVFVFVSRQLEP